MSPKGKCSSAEGSFSWRVTQSFISCLRSLNYGAIDFEHSGITGAQGGPNFAPYIKLPGRGRPECTVRGDHGRDPDEDGDSAGVDRLRDLLSVITGNDDADDEEEEEVIALAKPTALLWGSILSK